MAHGWVWVVIGWPKRLAERARRPERRWIEARADAKRGLWKIAGIDVTVSLATRINSIIRAVDQDSFHTGLYTGLNWPAGVFNCQQIWTGGVDNYIPDVRLTGNLKIAPGLTSDGHLRIAKATVSSQAGYSARFAVAACLMPNTTYAGRLANATVPAVGGPNTPPGGVAGRSSGMPDGRRRPV